MVAQPAQHHLGSDKHTQGQEQDQRFKRYRCKVEDGRGVDFPTPPSPSGTRTRTLRFRTWV
jgi:hypothetical protein